MDWWDQSTYSHWIGGYTSVSGSISIAKFTRTENNCNSAEANAQMCAMCTQHKTVCFFAKHSISLYVLAFRLHSLQFNVSRFHLINIRLFVHIRSHSCTSATTFIQINPAGRKFCPNFWAKTQYSYKNCFGLWQFLTDCVVIFTETNLFECVCIRVRLWRFFSVGISKLMQYTTLLLSPSLFLSGSIHICVPQALENIQKCNGADVNNNDSNMCSCALNKLHVWISVGFSMQTWWRRGVKRKRTQTQKHLPASVALSPFNIASLVQHSSTAPKLNSPCVYVATQPNL